MMTLLDAASYFNNDEFADAYGSGEFFRGRLEPYPDTMRDSLATERRILITDANSVIPARQTVTSHGQTWMLGTMSLDTHRGQVLRNKYIAHRATTLATVGTFSQVIANAGLRRLWADRLWVKEWRETQESSDMVGNYQLFFAGSEDLGGDDMMVKVGNTWHISRADYATVGGFLVSAADELPEPVVVQVSYGTVAYNPRTDSRTSTTSSLTGLLLRWQSHFTYFANQAATYLPGDAKLIVRKTDMTTKSGDTVTAAGHAFRVIEVSDEGLVWGLHVRHA